MVAWNDSVIDPSRAPEGKHLKKFVVLGVPYEIRGDATGHVGERDWDAAKEGYADYLIDRITADYIPDLKEAAEEGGTFAARPGEEAEQRRAWDHLPRRDAALPDRLDAPHTRDGRLPLPCRERLPVRLGEPPGTRRLDGSRERNAAETIFSDLGLDFGATVATRANRS